MGGVGRAQPEDADDPRGDGVGELFERRLDARAGRAAGLVDDQLFSATIVMTLLTTLVTPPLLRLGLLAAGEAEPAAKPRVAEAAE